MNTNLKMEYLAGGDDYFGPNYGGATVYTNVRKGYGTECPNVGRLLKNLKFSLEMENGLMGSILNDGVAADVAAKKWLQKNSAVWTKWLEGVTAFDGSDGAKAVKKHLGM
jgi:glycine betaine/proline transport system substrate-binding protein